MLLYIFIIICLSYLFKFLLRINLLKIKINKKLNFYKLKKLIENDLLKYKDLINDFKIKVNTEVNCSIKVNLLISYNTYHKETR